MLDPQFGRIIWHLSR